MVVAIDTGLPTALFADMIESHSTLIDRVKFGWGTSLVTNDIKKKIQILRDHKVGFFFGGTLFEKFWANQQAEAYFDFLADMGCKSVEISDGSLEIPEDALVGVIGQAKSRGLEVFCEVGFKDDERSANFFPAQWVSAIENAQRAGADFIITEARESGSSGICRSSGELRIGLIEEIAQSYDRIEVSNIIFEAPSKDLQAYFISRFGPTVKLANIAFSDLVGLETLRRGLRFDTFFLLQK